MRRFSNTKLQTGLAMDLGFVLFVGRIEERSCICGVVNKK